MRLTAQNRGVQGSRSRVEDVTSERQHGSQGGAVAGEIRGRGEIAGEGQAVNRECQ